MGTISEASMSTGTQARKLSMPNQWARSQRLQCQRGHKHVNYQCQTNRHDLIGFNVNRDTSTQTINAKPMGMISEASMSTGTQARKLSLPNMGKISQASMSTGTQSRKLSMPNQWARFQML